ncbi:hypothetical protein HDU79_007397 [Rhizoclosmatium sp. JEL0117]|nr:hypothetical protein HDU79_007397 [Rhizoclosmatium sp. JEL0117]
MKLILLALLPSYSLACAVLWTPLRGIKYDSGTGLQTITSTLEDCFQFCTFTATGCSAVILTLDEDSDYTVWVPRDRPTFASGLMKTDNVVSLATGVQTWDSCANLCAKNLNCVFGDWGKSDLTCKLQVYNGFRKYNDYHSYVFPALWTPIPGIKYDNGGGGLYPPYKATLYACTTFCINNWECASIMYRTSTQECIIRGYLTSSVVADDSDYAVYVPRDNPTFALGLTQTDNVVTTISNIQSWDSCATQCFNNVNCAFADWGSNDNNCRLLSKVGTRQYNSNRYFIFPAQVAK